PANTGQEKSANPPRGSAPRGASARRRKDGPRPPNSRNGGGAASLSIWAVDLCAADLFATNLHVAGWHRPGFPPRQAGANQAASRGKKGPAGRTVQSFSRNSGPERNPMTDIPGLTLAVPAR